MPPSTCEYDRQQPDKPCQLHPHPLCQFFLCMVECLFPKLSLLKYHLLNAVNLMNCVENGCKQVGVIVGRFLLYNSHQPFKAKSTIDVLIWKGSELATFFPV